MAGQLLLHSPTLESVEMVEAVIKERSGELGPYQLWKALPKKMMYQTFQSILNYLEEFNKIVRKDGKLIWIWNPQLVKKYLNNPDLLAK